MLVGCIEIININICSENKKKSEDENIENGVSQIQSTFRMGVLAQEVAYKEEQTDEH